MEILKMTNEELLSSAKQLAAEERRLQVEFLWHLLEIQNRKLYLDVGYPSLFDYVTQELGHSESAAYRRIQAMRLLQSVPNVAEKIQEGTLNLTSAAQVQTFIKAENKSGTKMSYRQKIEVVEAAENKSSREVEKHLIGLKPENMIRPEKVRFVTSEIVEIRFMIPDSLKEKMDILKLRFSHVNHEMNYLNLVEYLVDRAMAKLGYKDKPLSPEVSGGPAEVLVGADSDRKQTIPENSRYISASIKKTIWERDGGRCTYTDLYTGKRCNGQYQLQVDHIFPWSCGGENKIENLRLLCAEHNRRKGRSFSDSIGH